MHPVHKIRAYFYRRNSVVCVSVCLLATFVNTTQTAEPIDIPFGWVTGGPKKPGIIWGPEPPNGRGNFGGCPTG